MTPDGKGPPACSRCGRPQPPAGPLRTSDGTPISRSTYLALAELAGDGLVCPECLSSPDVHSSDLVDSPSALSGLPPAGHTETPLDKQECRRLLRTQPIGRLAFTEHGRPVIRPAHFVLHACEIVLAWRTDQRVDGPRPEAAVTFEVDAYDPATGQGWWVCTLGHFRLITDKIQIRELDQLRFTPWVNEPDRHYFALRIDALHGERLRRQPNQAPEEPMDRGRC